jgi:hypothetical protein
MATVKRLRQIALGLPEVIDAPTWGGDPGFKVRKELLVHLYSDGRATFRIDPRTQLLHETPQHARDLPATRPIAGLRRPGILERRPCRLRRQCRRGFRSCNRTPTATYGSLGQSCWAHPSAKHARGPLRVKARSMLGR